MSAGEHSESRRQMAARQRRALIEAIRENDEAAVEEAVLALSRSRRIFAPLVFAVGAFVMLFQGLRTLFFNWRLTLIQVLPAMWIWLALLDLKEHTFKGKEFQAWHGGVEVLLVLAITLVTAACFYLNAVFAFAISQPGRPTIRPAFALARRHLRVVLGVGLVVGVALGLSVIVVPHFGHPWFGLSLGIVIGVMMLTYVTVPARLVGIKPVGSRRDKMAAAAIGGALGALICSPAYVIGRIGILSARLQCPLPARRRLPRGRVRPRGRRDRRRQGDQDECQARFRADGRARRRRRLGRSGAARRERPLEELEGQVAVALLLVDLGHGRESRDDMPVRDRRLLDGKLVELESAGGVSLLPEDVRDRGIRAGSILRCSGVEARQDAKQKLRCFIPSPRAERRAPVRP